MRRERVMIASCTRADYIRSMDSRYEVLDDAVRLAHGFIEGLPARPVGSQAGIEELRSCLARPLSEDGEDARVVIAELARDAEPGLIASPGPRYFGFVIGGALPVAVAADWLTSAWDQNAGGYVAAPSLSVVEEVAAGWVRELLGLPAGCGIGFITGCQMAHFTCLAAARDAVLRDAGWDVEAKGLQGAPELCVIAGDHAHVTVTVACACSGSGGAYSPRRHRRPGPHAAGRPPARARRARRSDHRLRPGRRAQHRRLRSSRGNR